MADTAETDPFDHLLTLEDQYYQEGLKLGIADASRSGRIEGRQFGLERGFEKFAAMGALAGQCAVWEARVSRGGKSTGSSGSSTETSPSAARNEGPTATTMPPLEDNDRLKKHVQTLSALAEAESLSTQNDEDSVSEFDDRLKRAQGKVKVIQNIIGEGTASSTVNESKATKKGNSNMEDFSI